MSVCLPQFLQHGLGGPTVGTHWCTVMQPQITFVQTQPTVIAGRRCATMT
jgi:hypothetical protein